MFESFFNVVLILLGFGLVIVVHELGHFLAARWAGVRVHAFAVGFGPAIASWRKGIGLRTGSSEAEYLALVSRAGGATPTRADADAHLDRFAAGTVRGVSPTEYRLNWFPFGGYVKMLGQEDANPAAQSSAPDSYTSVPVWKRMIIISAGVVMNVVLAAVLFVIVFMAGMREVAPVIGQVVPASPAAKAGLREGDVVRSIDGRPAVSFSDLQIATAMAGRGDTVRMEVERAGQTVELGVQPVEGGVMRLMQIGVGPASSRKVFAKPARPSERRIADEIMAGIGFDAVPYGSTLESINGVPIPDPSPGGVATLEPLHLATLDSGGRELALGFRGRDGQFVSVTMKPEAEYPRAFAQVEGRDPVEATHVLGLMPLMKADAVTEAGKSAGIVPGDVFVKVGEHEYPDIATAVSAIRAAAGGKIPLVIERAAGPDGPRRVSLNADVSKEGTIGFNIREATETARVACVRAKWSDSAAAPIVPAFELPGGAVITRVNQRAVSDFAMLREAMKAAAAEVAPGAAPTISLTHRSDGGSGGAGEAGGAGGSGGSGGVQDLQAAEQTVVVRLTPAQVEALARVTWRVPPQVDAVFQPAQVVVKADGPADALMMGVAKTKRVLVMTYLTFLRLFQGTVKVEHLKGPVGIVDLGSRFAEEGFVYVLFFLGLISANLAVVNFLPLPIVDGGLFLMLCYEGLARRPVPVRVQNAVTMAGLALIGTMFIIVTFNDIMSLAR